MRLKSGWNASAASRCRQSIASSPSPCLANCGPWLTGSPAGSMPRFSLPPGRRCRPFAGTTPPPSEKSVRSDPNAQRHSSHRYSTASRGRWRPARNLQEASRIARVPTAQARKALGLPTTTSPSCPPVPAQGEWAKKNQPRKVGFWNLGGGTRNRTRDHLQAQMVTHQL